MRNGAGTFERKRIGSIIRQARKDAGLSRKDVAGRVAQRSGSPLTVHAYDSIEQGVTEIYWYYVVQIARITQKPLDHFI